MAIHGAGSPLRYLATTFSECSSGSSAPSPKYTAMIYCLFVNNFHEYRLQLLQSLFLNLSDSLSGQFVLLSHFFEGMLAVWSKSKPQYDHSRFSFAQSLFDDSLQFSLVGKIERR